MEKQMTRGQTGLTLVELLVAIAVLAVLLTLAVPSFQELRQQYQVRSAGMVVYSDLQLARSEAIKRNRAVTVCFSGSGTLDWSYQLLDSADCSGDVIQSVSSQYFPSITLTSNYVGTEKKLTFWPRRNTLLAGNVAISKGTQEMRVVTSNVSGIRTCSNQSLIGVPSPCPS
ncbi:GspH/FimT family pseudopilin [Zobellella denitrificans]